MAEEVEPTEEEVQTEVDLEALTSLQTITEQQIADIESAIENGENLSEEQLEIYQQQLLTANQKKTEILAGIAAKSAGAFPCSNSINKTPIVSTSKAPWGGAGSYDPAANAEQDFAAELEAQLLIDSQAQEIIATITETSTNITTVMEEAQGAYKKLVSLLTGTEGFSMEQIISEACEKARTEYASYPEELKVAVNTDAANTDFKKVTPEEYYVEPPADPVVEGEEEVVPLTEEEKEEEAASNEELDAATEGFTCIPAQNIAGIPCAILEKVLKPVGGVTEILLELLGTVGLVLEGSDIVSGEDGEGATSNSSNPNKNKSIEGIGHGAAVEVEMTSLSSININSNYRNLYELTYSYISTRKKLVFAIPPQVRVISIPAGIFRENFSSTGSLTKKMFIEVPLGFSKLVLNVSTHLPDNPEQITILKQF